MIINLTQMRIWEMNPHLPKPTPNTLPAGFLCAGMPTGTHRETGFPNQDTASPSLRMGDSFPLATPTSPAAPGLPLGMRRGIFPTHIHLVFTALQRWENYPPTAVGRASRCPRQLAWQEVGAGTHQAELLVSGLQAAWSSTDADSTTGPSGAAEKGRGTGTVAGSSRKQCWKLVTACFRGSPSRSNKGA